MSETKQIITVTISVATMFIGATGLGEGIRVSSVWLIISSSINICAGLIMTLIMFNMRDKSIHREN